MTERQCKAHVAHGPHVWPQGLATRSPQAQGGPWHCKGRTSSEIAQEAMVAKGKRTEGWRHLVDVHGLQVSEAAYGRNATLWYQVDKAIHEAYDRGYAMGMGEAAEAVSQLTEPSPTAYAPRVVRLQ